MRNIDHVEAITGVIWYSSYLSILHKVVEALLVVVQGLDLDPALLLAFLVVFGLVREGPGVARLLSQLEALLFRYRAPAPSKANNMFKPNS